MVSNQKHEDQVKGVAASEPGDLFQDEKDEAVANSILEQVGSKQKNMDYHIREYPVETVVSKFLEGLEEDEAELFIPDYQREYIWDDKQQSRFIESLIVDLPIPFLFVADIEEKDARLEIVDGVQRIRTLVSFMTNKLTLDKLKLLSLLNGKTYESLPKKLKYRFNRKTIRLIELSSKMDEEGRKELFNRLNSGGTMLKPIEVRRGSQSGPFLDLIEDIAETNDLFSKLCPISEAKKKHREKEELILRFFAYLEDYQNFEKSVDEFLTNFLDNKNNSNFDGQMLKLELNKTLEFIDKTIPYGFRKTPTSNTVPRIRFEALAIGTALALRENPDLIPPEDKITDLLDSRIFKLHTRSDASNSKPRVEARLELVRDFMLGKDVSDYSPPASRQTSLEKKLF